MKGTGYNYIGMMEQEGKRLRVTAPILLRKGAVNYIRPKAVKGLQYSPEKIGNWLRGKE